MKAHLFVAAVVPVLLALTACSGAPDAGDETGADEGASTQTDKAGYQLCRVELGGTVQRSVKYTKGAFAATDGFSVAGASSFSCGAILAEHGLVTPVNSFEDLKNVPFSALAVRGIFTPAEVVAIKAAIASYVAPVDDPQAAGRWAFHDGLGLAQERVNGLLEFLNSGKDTYGSNGVAYGASGACNNAKGWHLTQFPSPSQYGFTCHERIADAQTLLKCASTPTTKWDDVPQANACVVPASTAGAPTAQVATIDGIQVLQSGCYFDFKNTGTTTASVKAQWTVDSGNWIGFGPGNVGPSCNATIGANRSSSCSAWGTYGRAVTLTVNGRAFHMPNGC
jgi:hypothetical protein